MPSDDFVMPDDGRYFSLINLTDPSYLKAYDYEKEFDLNNARSWFYCRWKISIFLSWAYLSLVTLGPEIMQYYEPFKLKVTYAWWNFSLSMFSIMIFVRTAPELLIILSQPNGFHNSCCKWVTHSHATAYWSHFMCCTKVLELLDTAFIVFRKQKLIFLHWYHHMSTLISWWYMYSAYEPNQLWYIVMNAFVHSFMYMYYFLRGINVNMPRRVAYSITCTQILQMAVGLIVNFYAFYIMVIQGRRQDCDRGMFSLKLSFWMYGSFMVLFCVFFHGAYIAKRTREVVVEQPPTEIPILPDYQAAGDHLHFD